MLVNCKACGKEIGKGVKKCVHCGTDQRNFFAKHKIITGILVIVVLGIIGAASSGGKSNSASSTASTSNTSAPAATQTKPAELSNTGISSNVTITVTGFTSADSVGDNPYATAKAQGVFKVIGLSITNNQKDAITVDTNSFKLVDDQGREFTASTEAQTAMMSSTDSSKDNFFLKSINPGITVNGKVAFDVPKDAKGFKLKARGGMTGSEITLKVE